MHRNPAFRCGRPAGRPYISRLTIGYLLFAIRSLLSIQLVDKAGLLDFPHETIVSDVLEPYRPRGLAR